MKLDLPNWMLEENVPLLEAKKTEVPTFEGYRRIEGHKIRPDVVMTPDRGFRKQLKALDSEYDVVWDWGSSLWEIWKFPKEKGDTPYLVLRVSTKGKKYRELGTDILMQLQRNRQFGYTELINYLEEMDKQIMRRRAKEFSTKIKDIAAESFINVHCKVIQVPRAYRIGRAING